MKRLFSVFLCLAVWLSAFAWDFQVNGIYYNIIDSGQVEVTRGPSHYSGSVVISSSVTYTDNDGNVHTYSVTSICDGAFSTSLLTSVTIPNSVTSIGDDAFHGCSSLTSVVIPNSVTSIGKNAFAVCYCLTSISVDAGNTHYDSRNNCNAIIETSTNTLIVGCQNTIIPNNVTSIGETAFYDCRLMKSVTIPNSVTSIGAGAFSDCRSLTSVTIPNGVTSIADGTFQYCVALRSVTIPDSVTSIGDRAFSGCSGLTSLTIPNSVTSIGNSAFSGCSGLTSLTIPNSVTSIGNSAFESCSNLTSVTIPNSVTSIGHSAFKSCSNLTSVTIPNGVTSIANGTFQYCLALRSVTIPDSVTSIGNFAFYGCSNITDIICFAVIPPTIQPTTFDNYNPTLYVPFGSISLYQSAYRWKDFNIQPIPNLNHTITVDSNDELMGITMGSGTYEENTNAQLVAVTQAGYSFLRWRDGNTDNPRTVLVTQDSAFTAEFAMAGGISDTIYLEYDGKDAMQYSLEDYGVYYFGGRVYNPNNLYIKLYYSDGKLLSSGTNDIDISYYATGIYIVTDGNGGFLKINHYR